MNKNFTSIVSLSLFTLVALSMTACGQSLSKASAAAPLQTVGAVTPLQGRWQDACDPVTAFLITWDFAGSAFRKTTEQYAQYTNCSGDPVSALIASGTFSISNNGSYTTYGSYSSLSLNFTTGQAAETAAYTLQGNDLQISETPSSDGTPGNFVDYIQITDGS